MFAVVTLKHSHKNIVIPSTWLDGIKIFDFANDGCSNSLPIKVFYSTNKQKPANFALPIKDFYEDLTSENCYIGFLRKFFGNYLLL